MALTVKAQVCSLAASRCGDNGTVENIDEPRKPIEKLFAKWWLPSLEMALKEMKPSFATVRRLLPEDSATPEFGYSHQYEYPGDCLAFLGIGNIKDKDKNYTIENGYIMTDYSDDSLEGLPARMIVLVEDVSKFTPEFIEELTWFLATNVNMELTESVQRQSFLEQKLASIKPQCAGLDSQENFPVRKNTSKFKQARYNARVQEVNKL